METIDHLQRANRTLRDPRVEARLMRLRRSAFGAMPRAPGEPAWPPPSTAPPASGLGIPVVTRDQLTPELMRGAVFGHGSLLVKGLLDPDRIELFKNIVDSAIAAYDATVGGTASAETSRWYSPFSEMVTGGVGRGFVREGGGVLTADSPRGFFHLVDTLAELGIDRLIAAFLGERPAVSAEKCTLRRVKAEGGSAWHQDGAFLGADIRALNLWVTLSACGRDAPGLDIIPRRIPGILPTGTPGAQFSWSVSQELVDVEFADLEILRPQFEPGDAVFFDHLCLHRTALEAGMTQTRYALENWFFAPSCYPTTQTGICF